MIASGTDTDYFGVQLLNPIPTYTTLREQAFETEDGYIKDLYMEGGIYDEKASEIYNLHTRVEDANRYVFYSDKDLTFSVKKMSF